jgi:tetratricopeptide (TPR) repeat protein
MNREKNGVAAQEEAIQSFEVLQEQGDRYTSVGDYTQAQHCYGKAASLSPDAPSPYVGLGVVAFQKDLLDDAEISFRVACRLDPGCSRAYAGMAMIAQERADYEKAFEMYLKCLELDTDNLTALLGLFQASCQMGSFAKVIHYLKLYLSIHPKDNSVKFTLAALYVREGNFQRSRIILLDILTSDPGNDDAANLLEEVDRNLRAGVQIL